MESDLFAHNSTTWKLLVLHSEVKKQKIDQTVLKHQPLFIYNISRQNKHTNGSQSNPKEVQ